MSRMLKHGGARGASPLRRALKFESLEDRITMDGAGVLPNCVPLSQPSPDTEPPPIVITPTDEATESPAPVKISSANNNPAILDRNGNGRIEADELQQWIRWWRTEREAATPVEPAPEPPQFEEVPDYGGLNDRHLNAINAPEAWHAGHYGDGVTIAIIDTGIDLRHPEFIDKLWTNKDEIPGNGRDDDGNGFVDDVHGWDFVNDDADPQDTNGHGTHVAGLIAGARDGQGVTGAAYGAEIMVLQALDGDGVGNTRDLAKAIRYAVDEGADVINLSLAGTHSTSIESAIAYAQQRDVLIVAAAGNHGADTPSSPASLSSKYSNVIAVGAVDSSRQLASFSNQAGNAVQVVAPGVSLLSAVPNGYGRYSGTSMATPLVSAVAALTLDARPSLSAAQLRSALVSTTQATADDSYGLVDALGALRKAA